MAKRIHIISYFIIALILLVDYYIHADLVNLTNVNPLFFGLIYWIVPVILLVYLMILIQHQSFYQRDPRAQKKYFHFFGLFILFYIPKMFFVVFSIAEKVITWVTNWFASEEISLSVISYTGLAIAVGLFLLILYGILIGRFRFRTERITIQHPDLPEAFNGLKVVQISDLHIGSWIGHANKLRKAVERINRENPDLIVFTGDLFNNLYQEIEGFENILKSLQAKEDKLAVLGNHDYGDYFPWSSNADKQMNFKAIKESYRRIGFRLLCNEAWMLSRNHSSISFIGVENWGLPPFHQYGDLSLAMSQLNGSEFSILLSHDPSHWKEQVVGRDNIKLTLSGHTHGMQFGIYNNKLKWSPSRLKYREWGGLYKRNNQFLYVNKGLGYIGFPGRIGIWPEITVITLNK